MKLRKVTAALLIAVMAVSAAGCGEKETATEAEPTVEATEAPTATPTPVTATPTPAPVIKVLGEKEENSRFIEITNSTQKELKELYLRVHGTEEWGENQMTAEMAIAPEEIMQLNYVPSDQEDATYDIKCKDSEGNEYEMSYLKLADMNKASLLLEEDAMFMQYQSLSEKKEVNSKDVTAQLQEQEQAAQATSEGTDSGQSTYDDSSYDGGSDTYSDDSYYDDSYSDDYYSGDGYSDDYYGSDYTDSDSYGDDSGNYGDGGGDGAGGDTGCADSGCGDTGGNIIVDENGNWSVE